MARQGDARGSWCFGRRLDVKRLRWHRGISFVLHTLLYFCILRNDPPLDHFDFRFTIGLLVLSYAVFAVWVWRLPLMNSREKTQLVSLEIMGLAMLAVSCFTTVRFLDIACYHFVFWWFYPATKLPSRTAVRNYLLPTTALVVGSFLLSPAGLFTNYPIRNSFFLKQFLLWSHIHITSSFFLSTAHPEWLTRWFVPRSRRMIAQTSGSPVPADVSS